MSSATKTTQSLEDLLQKAGNPANMLRNSQIGAYVYPVVPAEYSNWREEQRAWRESCIMFDLSHHMVNLYVEGPDAVKLVSHLGFNSFANFTLDRARQFAPATTMATSSATGFCFLWNRTRSRLSAVPQQPHGLSSMRRREDTTSRPRWMTARRQTQGEGSHSYAVPLPDSRTECQTGARKTERWTAS